jgi:hypothetical protein
MLDVYTLWNVQSRRNISETYINRQRHNKHQYLANTYQHHNRGTLQTCVVPAVFCLAVYKSERQTNPSENFEIEVISFSSAINGRRSKKQSSTRLHSLVTMKKSVPSKSPSYQKPRLSGSILYWCQKWDSILRVNPTRHLFMDRLEQLLNDMKATVIAGQEQMECVTPTQTWNAGLENYYSWSVGESAIRQQGSTKNCRRWGNQLTLEERVIVSAKKETLVSSTGPQVPYLACGQRRAIGLNSKCRIGDK